MRLIALFPLMIAACTGTGTAPPSKPTAASAPAPPVIVVPPNAPPPAPWVVGATVVVPGGDGTIGRDDFQHAEEPAHRVRVATFALDVLEVTAAQYAACAAARVCAPPGTTVTASSSDKPAEVAAESAMCNAGKPDRGNHPVNCVTWYDAAHFCLWVGKRLPTEEEWEYAARFPDGRLYPWGPTHPVDQGCWQSTRPSGTCPVGTHPAGRSALGIHDLGGNVWEMTSSVWRPDYRSPPLGGLFTERGGSFFEGFLDSYFSTPTRRLINPIKRQANVGFRCAR